MLLSDHNTQVLCDSCFSLLGSFLPFLCPVSSRSQHESSSFNLTLGHNVHFLLNVHFQSGTFVLSPVTNLQDTSAKLVLQISPQNVSLPGCLQEMLLVIMAIIYIFFFLFFILTYCLLSLIRCINSQKFVSTVHLVGVYMVKSWSVSRTQRCYGEEHRREQWRPGGVEVMVASLQNGPGTLFEQLIFLAKTQIWKLCPWPDVHAESCQNRAVCAVSFAVFPNNVHGDARPYLGKSETLDKLWICSYGLKYCTLMLNQLSNSLRHPFVVISLQRY